MSRHNHAVSLWYITGKCWQIWKYLEKNTEIIVSETFVTSKQKKNIRLGVN